MVETSSSSTTKVSQILAENTQEGEEEIKGAAFRKGSCLPKSSSFERAKGQKGRRAEGQKAKKQTRGRRAKGKKATNMED